ncbi:hypothetical protein AB0B31_14615 [Catellatospora citrea]|uniref:hypothetical protein n=1 Tax=Catellatospora citrea TaxID=53366 RepID=UPI0033E96D50
MSTIEKVAGHLADGLLSRWPGGTLLSAPVSTVLATTLTKVYAMTGAQAPGGVDRWLATLVGADRKRTGDSLARQAADQLLAVVSGMVSAPTSLAAAGMPALSPLSGTAPAAKAAMSMLPTFPAPPDWSEAAVIRALLRMGKVGLMEIPLLLERLPIATAAAGSALVLPGIRSTADVGNQVHRSLQGRYRQSYAPPNLVVTDRRVFGPTMPATGRPLSEAVVGGPPQLAPMILGWLNPKFMSTRRADVTDLSRWSNWEIKPFLQAPTAVLQESWYRCSYNWVAQSLADEFPPLRGVYGWLMPGMPWEPSLLRAIPVGGTAIAVPFTTMALPGIVLYAVVSDPRMADIAVLVALMLMLIEKELKRRLKELAEGALVLARALAEIVDSIAAFLADAIVAIVITVAIAGLIAAAVLSSPGWAVGGTMVATGAALLFVLSQFGPRQPPPGVDGDLAADATPIALDFGGVSVSLPAGDVGKLMAALHPVIAAGLGTMAQSVREATDTAVA